MGSTHHSSSRRWVAVATTALAALALASCSSPASAPAGDVDTRPITLPDRAGDLHSYALECEEANTDADRISTCLEGAESNVVIGAELADRVSEAYDGAAAAAGSYATGGFFVQAMVIAVRADSPGLWTSRGGEAWEERAGIVSPERVETRDGVDCIVITNGTYRLDADREAIGFVVGTCQKSADGLTVQVDFNGSLSTEDYSLDDAFAWTAAAYDAIK